MPAAFQGNQGPETETSVLLLQINLRKPRAGAQQELKEKETEDLKQQKRMCHFSHTRGWRSQSLP